MSVVSVFRLQALAPAGAAAAVLAAVTAASLSKISDTDEITMAEAPLSPDASPRLSNSEASGEDASGPAALPDDRAPAADADPAPDHQAIPADVRSPVSDSLEIVVGMTDAGDVQPIAEAYFRDPAQGRKLYDAFRAKHPAFAGLALDRVTYSNELVVTPQRTPPAGKELAALRQLAAKLSASPGVAYAEPNMIAKPGTK